MDDQCIDRRLASKQNLKLDWLSLFLSRVVLLMFGSSLKQLEINPADARQVHLLRPYAAVDYRP